jgi:hypothetical protein
VGVWIGGLVGEKVVGKCSAMAIIVITIMVIIIVNASESAVAIVVIVKALTHSVVQ